MKVKVRVEPQALFESAWMVRLPEMRPRQTASLLAVISLRLAAPSLSLLPPPRCHLEKPCVSE